MTQPTTRTDEGLFEQYRAHRDCAALGELFRRRADELLRLAVFLAPRPTEAEDLVQATFLSAIAHAEQFRPDGRVMSWLCGILTNHARMLRRSERRRQPPAHDKVAEDPAEAVLRGEVRAVLRRSIAALPEPYRAVVALHLESGLDSQEIGERLQRPAATVRKQMERALDRLRLALPLGLVTAFAARADAAAIATRAAEAAQFVSPPHATPPGGDASAWVEGTRRGRLFATMTLGAAALLGSLAWSTAWLAPAQRLESAQRSDADIAAVERPSRFAEGDDAPAPPRADRSAIGTATLAITCCDGAGAPLVDVEVLVALADGRPLPERLLVGGGVRSRRTDARGEAIVADLPLAIVDVAVPGAPARHRLTLTPGANACRLELARPAQLRGRVVDAAGVGIPDAELYASETGMRGDLGHRFAVTGPDGAFAGATHVRTGRIVAHHPAYALGPGARPQADRELRLTLPRRTPARIVEVVDAQGVVVPDAYVALVPRSAPGDLVPTQHARTDADGRCRMLDPGATVARLVAAAATGAPALLDLPRGDDPVRIALPIPHAVHGMVRHADSAPADGALVHVSVPDLRTNEPAAPLIAREFRTGPDGRFHVPALPQGPVAIRVLGGATGGIDLPRVPKVLAAHDAIAGPGAEPIVLVLREPASLCGRLVAPDGRPLAGWNVFATPGIGSAAHRQFRNRSASTDPDGWFAIHDLAERERYLLGAAPAGLAAGGACLPAPVGEGRAGEAGLRLVCDPLAHRHELRVRALDAAGLAPAELECEIRPESMPWTVVRGALADGSCRWTDLPAGGYLLTWFLARGGAQSMRVQVRDDTPCTDLAPITLAPAAPAIVRLHGRSTHAGARVVARAVQGDKFVAASTDAAGAARLEPLPAGLVELSVHGPGIAPSRRLVEVAPPAAVIDLETEPAATVSFTATFTVAENVFSVQGPLHVRILDAQGDLVVEDYVEAASAPGRFEFRLGLPVGEHRVHARALWNAAATADFVVPATSDDVAVALSLRR